MSESTYKESAENARREFNNAHYMSAIFQRKSENDYRAVANDGLCELLVMLDVELANVNEPRRADDAERQADIDLRNALALVNSSQNLEPGNGK